MKISMQFLGAAQTVTGSKFLLNCDNKKILIDCGLFQGVKEFRLKNWAPLQVDPTLINAVILTHAHLDHTGYLPLLVKTGFSGPIYCTQPTRELTEVILNDAAKIQEEDAEYANRQGFSKHEPARPLYQCKDAKIAISKLVPRLPHEWFSIDKNIKFRLIPSGHILGSTFVEIDVGGKRIVFSGDLGRKKPLILNPPETISKADVIVIESTYGDRIHTKRSPLDALEKIINETYFKRGQLIIPSFAIGRAQDILYLITTLRKKNKIPSMPIYLDSPMGINATMIFSNHLDWHRLNQNEVNDLYKTVTMIKTQKESLELLNRKNPSIIIAGSGMITGGRVLHHLEKRLPDPKNTVLLVGFQAQGTRGNLLRSGLKEIKIHGKYIPVKAEIKEISHLSAHADQQEIIQWLSRFKKAPNKIFIVHGELQSSDALRVKIKDDLGWNAVIPSLNSIFDL